MSAAPVPVVDMFSVARPDRPYPGLRPFEKSEWPIFFGREVFAEEVVKRLVDQQLVVVHGDSGCGKSSLVRAAVLPRLEHENARGGIRWRTCTTRPGESPLWNLAYALADLGGDGERDERALDVRRALNCGNHASAEIAERLHLARNDHVCVLVDQFEELFDHARRHGPGEAALVAEVLSGMAKPPEGLYVIVTMRSEYLGACARFAGLAETINVTQYLLPAMNREDTRRAIREPALLYAGEIDSALADKLIADAAGMADKLPLLQHALMLLYRRKLEKSPPQGWKLDLEDYPDGLGLAGLLSDHADAVMCEARQHAGLADDSRVIEDLFRAISDMNTDGNPIRRPQLFDNLLGVVGTDERTLRRVVETFSGDGVSFITSQRDRLHPERERIDIGHEALLRYWRKISDANNGWLVRETRNGLVWKSLLVQAESFDRNRQNILGAETTRERVHWMRRRNEKWAERYGGGWRRVQALLGASDAAQKAATRKLRSLKALLAVASIAVVSIGVYSVVALNRAKLDAQRRELQNYTLVTSLRMSQAQQLAQQEVLKQSIAALQDAVKQPSTSALNPKVSAELSAVAQAATNLSSSSPSASDALAPRVYIQIADGKQRDAAGRFSKRLAARSLDGVSIVVPGIELVKVSPSQTVLRCFRADECKANATRLLEIVNSLLMSPQARLEDLSARYGASTNIRDRHFELWFAPGDIEPKN